MYINKKQNTPQERKGATKTDEFAEKFQTATFADNHTAIFPEKARLKDPKSAIQILGLKTTPPPLELIQKFIRFGTLTRPKAY